jgi:hypothetical protein
MGIAIDKGGRVYVCDRDVGIFVYQKGSRGNVAPIATITGSNTTFGAPIGVSLH